MLNDDISISEGIRVLIVDDSALRRAGIQAILESDPEIDVVGMAKDGKEGVDKAIKLKPDVITMDINMPVMTGLEAIEHIMHFQPTPIIVVSSMDVKVVVKALGIGAMDFVAMVDDLEAISKELIEKVKIASRVRPIRRYRLAPRKVVDKDVKAEKKSDNHIVAVGISTGGPQALKVLLSSLPVNFLVPIVIVQHMTKGFIEGLAQWLQTESGMNVKVAKEGDRVEAGKIFLAPDDYHLEIDSKGRVHLREEVSGVGLHVPSVDVMFRSVAKAFGDKAIAVIMTGMGSDGVAGLSDVKDAGGVAIAQDEKSSVIFGMNAVAIQKGLVDHVVALDNISDKLVELIGG